MIGRMQKKLVPLTQSKAYVDFANGNAKALMRIYQVHIRAADLIMGKLQSKVLHLLHDARSVHQFVRTGHGPIRNEFELAAAQLAELMKRLRAEAYFLAHIGEAEAIGRALEKPTRFNVHTKTRRHFVLHDGVMIDDRVQIMLDRIRRKIEDALSLSMAMGSTPEETLQRVKRAFGKPGARPKPRGVSKRIELKEAKKPIPTEDPGSTIRSMTFGFADEDLWDDVLDDYFSDELPTDIFRRGPTDKTLFYDIDTTLGTAEVGEERYAWEVENEISEDFVRSVRAGEQDAANENGITDFEWLAILDNETDECCIERDGLLSAEIEKMLSDGTLDADDSDASVAPAHVKCRCRSVPATDDLPETPEVDYEGFDTWIEARGKAA